MVVISKMMWDEKVADGSCSDLIHPWTNSCSHGFVTLLGSSLKGGYKFYAIIYLVQLLIKAKKIKDKDFLKKQFISYLKSGGFGAAVGTSFVPLNCLLRRFIFDKYYYYSTIFLPMTISGFAIYMEPPHRRYLVVSFFFNLVLEYWVRAFQQQGLLKVTTLRQTLLFMCGSACLFYLMRQEKDKNKRINLLWFFTPPKVNRNPEEKKDDNRNKLSKYCPHTGYCSDYVLKGFLQMFGAGCAMTMMKTILPKIRTPVKAIKSIKPQHFRLGLFFGGYIGIYRLIVCLLCRHYKRDSTKHALPAGFLAGTAFAFNPSISISLLSFTSTMHILCGRLYEKKLLPENIPLAEIIYAVCQGFLFHVRVMNPEACPRYILNLVYQVTSGKVDYVYNNIVKRVTDC